MGKVCPNCFQEFETAKSNKKFCSNDCKVKYNNDLKTGRVEQFSATPIPLPEPKPSERLLDPETQRLQDASRQGKVIEDENKKIQAEIDKWSDVKRNLIQDIRLHEEVALNIQKEINEKTHTSDFDYMKFIDEQILKDTPHIRGASGGFVDDVWNAERERVKHNLQNEKSLLKGNFNIVKEHIIVLKGEVEGADKEIHKHIALLKRNQEQRNELYQVWFNLQKKAKEKEKRKSTKRESQHQKSRIGKEGIGAADLRNMTFATFELPTELGEFLGRLERNRLAIALTGDSGAGKSHFSYQLAKLFVGEGYSVKYFSLEESISHGAQEKSILYNLTNDVLIVDEGELIDVREAAQEYDLVIVDSFQKLKVKAEEYDNLRQDFPNTIFIVIFQKTADGKIKGGASITFDSDASIEIQKKDKRSPRIAVMKKSRSDREMWVYNIDSNEIMSRGK